MKKFFNNLAFVRGIGYLQSFAKVGDKEFIVKAAKAFGFFAEKFPKDPKAVLAMQKKNRLSSFPAGMESSRVIEILLDPAQPYRKQIVKRSELLSLLWKGTMLSYRTGMGQGEPAFRDLLKFADAAKDEDRAAYAVSCLTEMFVQTKRIDEVFRFFLAYPEIHPPVTIFVSMLT